MKKIPILLGALVIGGLAMAVSPGTRVNAEAVPHDNQAQPVPMDSIDGVDHGYLPRIPDAQAWDERATWSSSYADLAVWQAVCGDSPAFLDPGVAASCAVEVMKQTGASEEAISFFQTTGYFLDSFEKLGPIDYGRGAVPWFNMGRPTQQLFLNGTPSIVEAPVGAMSDWKDDPSYADVVASDEWVSPWTEYGELSVSVLNPSPGITQLVELRIPLRSCRACPPLGYAPLRYEFHRDGRLTSANLLPFVEP